MVPMNRRILSVAILIFSMLFILPTNSLSGLQKEYEQDAMNVYPLTLQKIQDDQQGTSSLFLTETELNHLIDTIDQMMSDTTRGENPHEIMMQLVTKRGAWKYPLLSAMMNVLIRLRMIHNPVFIISQGWSYTLNPMRNTTLDLYRLLGIWHYGPGCYETTYLVFNRVNKWNDCKG